jgi:hypothetical protein
LLAKKKGSTGGTGTCTALIFSLRLSGGLTRFQLYIFCSKNWLMFNGLCFVAYLIPNSNFMISDLAIRSGYIEADHNATLWQCNTCAI